MAYRVAVIGGGAAGLSAAYHLRDVADVTLFERDHRAGGHANTIEVTEEDGRTVGVDTAFVVFNEGTYPRLTAFFADLGVRVNAHTGGFNFFDTDTGVQYGTADLDLPRDQVEGAYPASFVSIWRQAKRFHQRAPKDFVRRRADSSLGEYLDANGYTQDFKHSYIMLMCSATWSIPPELIWEMPASTLIAFFLSHDEGGLGGRKIDWKTVDGGSIRYVRRALARIGGRQRLGTAVAGVREEDDHVAVRLAGGDVERFDQAVVATHADQALELLNGPHPARAYLEKIPYHHSRAVLHRDPNVLPVPRDRWVSWNYGAVTREGRRSAFVVYYMNAIQGFQAIHDYFVTLDCPIPIRDELVVKEMAYSHPVINCDVHAMQRSIYDVLGRSRVKLCGSYFHSRRVGPDLIGSHESAFCSGMAAAGAVQRHIEQPVSV